MTKSPLQIIGISLIVLPCIIGCDSVESVPVAGVVTLNDKPLPDAVIMFAPVRGNGPGPFVGKTDSDGHFALGTRDRPGAGAASGEYSVFIATVMSDPNEDSQTSTRTEVVPSDYRNGSKKYSVPEGGTKTLKFAMKFPRQIGPRK